MAYAGLFSLELKIKPILGSSVVSHSREILEFAYEEVKSFVQALERSEKVSNSSERMKALEGQMREAACKLDDVLESHFPVQFLSRSPSLGNEIRPLLFSLDPRQDIDRFVETTRKLKNEYIKELDSLFTEEEEDAAAAVSFQTDICGNKTEMVGLTDFFLLIRDHVTRYLNRVISIVGMAGIGKTALAKKIFNDPLIVKSFECRAFVRIGQKYQLQEVLQAILAQVNRGSDEMLVEGDENLWKSLKGRRYLVVLDDVWDPHFWPEFARKLPQGHNRSKILMTTRLKKIAISSSSDTWHMPFLNKEESWDLLRGKVFAEEKCPPQLDKAGKKIAEDCEGLPLLILKVADLLSVVEKTPEYWNNVAENRENSIFTDAYDQMLEVLYPSYNYLPPHLKDCFLYMVALPQNTQVQPSKLINWWIAERFILPNRSERLQKFAVECFQELVSSSLVVVHQRSYHSDSVKACSLHSVYRHLCRGEAKKNNFLHILNSYADGFAEGIKSQSRLSIYKNVLFGIKDVYNSLASIPTVHSLLCTGPYHQYQVPICFGLEGLRVLDALTIRLYKFPMEVITLDQLRYLALTCNGNLPPSISKLRHLRYLIIHQHLSIKYTVAQSYLPVQIWNLQKLKYLETMGRNLPDPPRRTVLRNLLTLLDVGVHSCTRTVLESITNLKKLRVQIELAPDASEPLSYFDHISCLRQLKSLKCVVVNPKHRSEIVPPPSPLSIFTSSLRKLTLSGFGYPWKDMNKIAELPSLEVLKLYCYAFRGQKWEAQEKGFLSLEYLLIEDTDLVQWTTGDKIFPRLRYLTMKNCYKLQEIPNISSLGKIQLIDCNSLAVTCATETYYFKIDAYSSWDTGNLKGRFPTWF